jgi:hypothetical protein
MILLTKYKQYISLFLLFFFFATVIIFFVELNKLLLFFFRNFALYDLKTDSRSNWKFVPPKFFVFFFLPLEIMESIEEIQEQKNTFAILRQQIPPDLEYEYDHNTEYFKVLRLGTDKIANLQKLCELLACDSTRIVKFYCVGNLIGHMFYFSYPHFFFQVKVSMMKGPNISVNIFHSTLHSKHLIFHIIILTSRVSNIWLDLFDLTPHSRDSVLQEIVLVSKESNTLPNLFDSILHLKDSILHSTILAIKEPNIWPGFSKSILHSRN